MPQLYKTIQDEFISFLRTNHALKEYQEEVVQSTQYGVTFNKVLEDIKEDLETCESLLEDGFYFKWKEAVTDIVWKDLNEEWLKICEKEKWI